MRYSDETKTYTFSRQYSFFVFGLPAAPELPAGHGEQGPALEPAHRARLQLLGRPAALHLVLHRLHGRRLQRPPLRAGDVFAYDPEDVTSYEVGFKSELLGRTLRLNGAVYYMDWEDRQISLGCIGQPGCPRPATPFFQTTAATPR